MRIFIFYKYPVAQIKRYCLFKLFFKFLFDLKFVVIWVCDTHNCYENDHYSQQIASTRKITILHFGVTSRTMIPEPATSKILISEVAAKINLW